jgi:hypothetical protein
MVAQRVGQEAVLRGDSLSLRLPVAEVHLRPVYKDHGRACTLFDVGQIDAVHLELRHHRLLLQRDKIGSQHTTQTKDKNMAEKQGILLSWAYIAGLFSEAETL